ncbi:MFS transporter [Bifidobacterium sp.]|uniref:MFS transporter n=1 Tax=Bifidobacterium sp. TaxID=41200 RepID=UPI0025C42A93|nr:MFS transporter [Bifidobacterium sp.]MCH4209974.1 MFS transporter [Bifidobacterium sp.]MCI1225545.1 MFS transporter [Bifidobacterium sp.]
MPAILFATGEGALIPVVPLTATALGANVAEAGIISGLLMIGVVIGDMPAGIIVARWGETFAMRVAAATAIVSAIICWKAPNLIMLAAGVLMTGIASAAFNLARHTFLTVWTPLWYRARALSLLGGTSRVGYFFGPFLASPVIALAGSRSVYWLHVAACLTVLVVLWMTPDPEELLSKNKALAEVHNKARVSATPSSTASLTTSPAVSSTVPTAPTHQASPTPQADMAADSARDAAKKIGVQKLTHHRLPIVTYFPILIRMGIAAGILQAMRASRQVILPLWGVQLDVSESHIALIMGIAGAVDLSLFYTSGQIMDRFGRRWAAVPVLLGISISHLALPFALNEWGYVAVAILFSIANGLGSGIVMTLGSDLATRYAPDEMPGFLSGWRVFTDSGSAFGPLAISAMTAVSSLSGAAVLMGCCGMVGAFLMQRYIPRLVGK